MSPAASPSFPASDSRLKWKKRKRESNPGVGSSGGGKKQKQPPVAKQDDEDDDEEEEEEATGAGAAGAAPEEDEEDRDLAANANGGDPVVDLREGEVLVESGQRISDFPVVVRHAVNRPHPSVLAIVAAERAAAAGGAPSRPPFLLENISHGQLQVLSGVLPDNPALNAQLEPDKPPAYVCSPPALMEGKGVVKQFGEARVLVVPVHADWFSPNTVHRLERQVVPHFFSGRSNEHTPERYMSLRNRIIARYLENPAKRLQFADCQGFVPGTGGELYELSRIVRFLDHWGIINYLAATAHRGAKIGDSIVREEASGELHVHTAALRSIESLVQFERPRSSYSPEDISVLCSSMRSTGSSAEVPDLDSRIRERLSEHACSYCSCPLPQMHYQSQKEADIMLCSECFHEGRFIAGHSSVDFLWVESAKDLVDLDGDSWTDQETLLLLEALEVFNDNWNEIAEHVGTKSKAQCILHFIRLPMEDGLLENIELPCKTASSDTSKGKCNGVPNSNGNGYNSGVCLPDFSSSNRLPFANSGNPLMSLVRLYSLCIPSVSKICFEADGDPWYFYFHLLIALMAPLVAFLAAAVGPRVAATCASASLSMLTKEDTRSDRAHSETAHSEGGPRSEQANPVQREDSREGQGVQVTKDGASALSLERVKAAAMVGLSAAAMKAKLFADQEEREVQRLVVTVVHHQVNILKRLELKLKQFAEVETLLMKECEQVDRTRQRLSAERVRLSSTRFGQSGTVAPDVAITSVSTSNIRPPVMSSPIGQTSTPSGYGSNSQGHPHMPFMPRQTMFPFAPRLPLSAIHPGSSSTTNMMLSSGMTNAPSNPHPLLRPMSGNNTNIG
ncbi:hypothetical protein Taro_005132 [Colocasia esculenta]|uniref:SWI/SNF complex subunit SWI3C n=1 Tax=Colocasia esculenta TaxID=4460 RepID=A0A843TP53_COLES|nr:hypothetical protein [Colocasia esculenta]